MQMRKEGEEKTRKKKEGGGQVWEGRGAWALSRLGLHTRNARSPCMFFQFLITCKRTNNANNAIHYVKLGKKRRENSERNYYIISRRAIVKAIINHCIGLYCMTAQFSTQKLQSCLSTKYLNPGLFLVLPTLVGGYHSLGATFFGSEGGLIVGTCQPEDACQSATIVNSLSPQRAGLNPIRNSDSSYVVNWVRTARLIQLLS